MKIVYRTAAELIFLFHLGLFLLVVFFGWYVPSLWPWYIAALVATLISDLVYGYCILSKWEFDLRKKINPGTNYDFTWATHYTYKLTNHRISNVLYWWMSIFFLTASLANSLYFHFLY